MPKSRKADPPLPQLPDPYFSDGLVTLYWGDAAQIVPLLPKADLIIIDPPYGLNVFSRGFVGGNTYRDGIVANKCGGFGVVPSTKFEALDWDSRRTPDWLLAMLIAHAKHAIVWGANYYANAIPQSPCWLTWDKRINGDFADVELAWTNYTRSARRIQSDINRIPDMGDVAMFEFMWNGMLQGKLGGNSKRKEERLHPTQKPLQLMQWCLQLFPPLPKSVIDPMAGSGTVGRACKDLGIPCVLIERERKYCDVIVKRLNQESLLLPVIEEAPATLVDIPLFDEHDQPVSIPAAE